MSPRIRRSVALVVSALVCGAAFRPALAGEAPAPVPPVAAPTPVAPAPTPGPAPVAPIPPPAPAPYPYGAGYQPYPAPYGQYPGYAPYPQYPPAQVTMVHRKRRGALIAGSIAFGVSWGLGALISLSEASGSCTSNCDAASVMWIPVAGPFLAASRDQGPAPATFVFWGLVEIGGIALFTIGMVGRDVPEYRVGGRAGLRLRLAPMLARDTGGMALTARW